ncbi:hypothetical protein [Pantanalinema sp. GBBB05]|uniref:hypothetical protein n=1 Tax=Pantanalinema sp. GBBB05 TaxID=2604139 RepID=UPI001DC87FB3|nr:hypothetical protein [Pantanalinema sp. GBBB05]
MNTKAEQLLDQISQAQTIGELILASSGLAQNGIIYAFATSETLVINCLNLSTVWRVDDGHWKLRQAIAQLGLPITKICVEHEGKALYHL